VEVMASCHKAVLFKAVLFVAMVLVIIDGVEEQSLAKENQRLRSENLELQTRVKEFEVSKQRNLRMKRLGDSVQNTLLDPIPTNAARCNHNSQDQTNLLGTLDCENFPAEPSASIGATGSECPDDLTLGSYFMVTPANKAICSNFESSTAISSQATYMPTHKITTKALVAHPSFAESRAGVWGLKRVIQVSGTYTTFKVMICIKIPSSVTTYTGFAQDHEKLATTAEKIAFTRAAKANCFKNRNSGHEGKKLKNNCECNSDSKAKAAILLEVL